MILALGSIVNKIFEKNYLFLKRRKQNFAAGNTILLEKVIVVENLFTEKYHVKKSKRFGCSEFHLGLWSQRWEDSLKKKKKTDRHCKFP